MHKRLATLIAGLGLGLALALATSPTAAAVDCTTDTALCLQDGRFLVEATWKKSDGSSGAGHPMNLGPDSGYFWFLDPDNVELVVKALDGCTVNGYGWFFSGGLTNLEVAITVTDTATGEIRNYANPQGVAFQPIADTSAFGCPFGAAMFARNPEEPRDDDFAILPAPTLAERRAGAAPGCDASDSVLCIDGRFQVEASWQAASGRTGAAHAVSMTSASGYFWFFDPDNVELVVKALDACGIGRGQWFFAAGLTAVGVQIQVTDTFTGEIRAYANPLGTAFLPIQDTAAFAFCPTPNFGGGVSTTNCDDEYGHHPCRFNPSTIHVSVGESVHWTFRRGRTTHSTTSGSGGVPDGNWDSGVNDSGVNNAGYTHTFTQAGTYPYFCRTGNETGTVIVDP